MTSPFQENQRNGSGGDLKKEHFHFRKLKVCLYLVALLLLPVAPVFGLDPDELMRQMAHSSWGAKDGIIDVESIVQTRDGYLWIATAEGLFRFDGINFVQWLPKTADKDANVPVTILCAGRDGSLWMGSKNGINRLLDDKLDHFTTADGLPADEVTSILEDHTGAIWVGTMKGLCRFNNGHWLSYGKKNGLPEGKIRVELEDKLGNLWIAADDPDIAGGTLLGCLSPRQKHFELSREHLGTVAMLREAPDGQLWVAETAQSVRPFPSVSGKAAGQLHPISLQSKTILFDRDGTFWISAFGRGLYRIPYSHLGDLNMAESGLPRDQFNEKDGLSSDSISCVYEDQEGNVWFGSAGGLDRFRNNKIVSLSVGEGLSYDQHLTIAATADGALWTGSEQGLQRIEGSHVETLGFKWIGLEWGNGVYSLYASSSDDLWVGALNGVGHIKGREHSPVTIAGGMELRNVTAMTEDPEGGLWLCDQLRGVCRLAYGKIRVFPSGPQLSSQVVNTAITDTNGTVWLGFQDGTISRYQDGRFHAYTLPQSILALHCDRTGQIWAAGSGGLSRFHQDHFETLKATGDFPDTELSGMLEDDQGFFWLAGRSGLIRVSPEELDKAFKDSSHPIQCETFSSADGLRGFPRQSRPFPIAAKTRDGRLWFATTAGLAMIDPQHLSRNTNIPPVHITQVFVGSKKLEATSKDMRLPAGTSDIKIDYTAPSFVSPDRIRFRCKLDGYDQHWREMGTLRHVAYSGLRPGNYGFQVMACNSDGIWDHTGTQWQFSIRSAFYQTTWFLIGVCVAGAMIVVGLYRWNSARVTAQTEARMNARMDAQLDERKRIARELHDTLLQGFTGVRLKLWAISHRLLDSPEAASEQLKQVMQQADQCLTESRRSVWALRSARLEDMDLVSALQAMTRDLVAGSQLEWTFKTQGTPERLSNIVEFNLLRISEEAVANIIRHAEAKHVSVELHFKRRKVTLIISDDGCGFDPACATDTSGDHFGLAGMRERAKIIGGHLDLQSRPGGPTTLTVIIG